MGIWDIINSGTEIGKRNTPDLVTPVKKVCISSYNYSCAAVRKIDDGRQKLGQYIYMPDEDERAKIVDFITKFVKNASSVAASEAVNSIPGGRQVSQIYSQTVREFKMNQDTSRGKEITGNSSKDTTTGTGSPESLDGPETPQRIGNSSKDHTTTGTGSTELLDAAEMLESIGNSSKDHTATGTGSTELLDAAEMPESLGNSSKDHTTTGTDSTELLDAAEMPESIGNSSKDAIGTGSLQLLVGAQMLESIGNSSKETTPSTSSLKSLDGEEMPGSRKLQLGAAQQSLRPKSKL